MRCLQLCLCGKIVELLRYFKRSIKLFLRHAMILNVDKSDLSACFDQFFRCRAAVLCSTVR